MPENKDAGVPGRARLPGFDDQPGFDDDRGRPEYARDRGVRSSRRTSTWTAAALIAAVAATTGYLAHSMPSTSTGSGSTGGGYTTSKQSGHSGAAKHVAPGVNGPVVTSGGSGVAGAGRSGNGSGGAGGWSED